MELKKCLNGFWDFSADTKNVNEVPKRWDAHKICVPSPFNVNGFCAGRTKELAGEKFYVQGGDFCLYPDYPEEWDKAECGAYRRTFYVPEESRGRRLFLLFDAVAYHSKFYVNGISLKEEMEAFLPIEFEITDAVSYGEDNEILVIAENSKRFLYKDEKDWNRIDHPKGSFWGEYIAGIWQDVWYVERPETYIKDLFVTTDIERGKLQVKFELDGPVNAGMLRFALKDPENGESRSLGEAAAAEGRFEWSFEEDEIKLWETDAPALYELQAEFLEEERVCDSKCVRFGFRSFTVKGDQFYLNKRPINLKNDSWHYMGYSVQTPEYARSYYRMAKEAGVNIIRLHAQPFPSFFYDVADEMGMLLVSESAVWASHCNFSYNDAFFENSRRHLVRLILRDRNHPSVVLWSPENECIPAYKVSGSRFIKDEQELEYKLYEFLKVIYDYDTSRLISCDGSGDLGGRLLVNSLHYPGFECPTQKGKPITIGEMGSMYYSTPDMVCMENGQKTLLSSENRLWAVGEDAYRNLMGERRWAAQVCVFNLVWYGLEPLPFRDRLLTYEDYSAPGIKPGRITPYLRTLNAGGDESLPEYIPNPVWKLTQKAYAPVRSYIDGMPKQVYAGEVSSLPLFLFYDEREDGRLIFTLTVEDGENVLFRKSMELEMEACRAEETSVSITWPETEGKMLCRSAVSCGGKTVFEESSEVEVYEEKKLRETWESMGIACAGAEEDKTAGSCIMCLRSDGMPKEQVYEVRHVFGAGHEYCFNKPHSCLKKEIAGKGLYFDGSGQALIWCVQEEGALRIYSAIDLTAPTEAAEWLLLIELGSRLKREKAEKIRKIKLYGTQDSPYAALLKKLNYAYEIVDRQALARMLTEKQEDILLADGRMDMDFLFRISRSNFDTVVLAGLTAAPPVWSSELAVTDRKTFHAYPTPGAIEKFGIYGAGLYGLEDGKECLLAERLVEYQEKNDCDIAWKIPDVDWRMWNKNPEQLKTVSLHRSERADHSRLALLSLRRRGESDIWIDQLVPDAEHPKILRLWKHFLAGLGAGYGRKAAEETGQASFYDRGVKCLWAVESGELIERDQELPGKLEAGCCVYSPQDRTNFLYNPDMVHLEVHGEKALKVWLNGKLLGEGRSLRFTSIGLRAGVNRLVLVSEQDQHFPEILFERANGKESDLIIKKC